MTALLFLLVILLTCAPSLDARKGATNLSQLHKDQFVTGRSASNSPTSLNNAQPCPRGRYRPTGLTDVECELCPRGKYGSTEGLTTSQCTANCPTGRYYDKRGAETEEDCLYCPPGTYGSTAGLQTADCSGLCPVGKYSSKFGLTTDADCENCPDGYRGWQCTTEVTPRRGHFVSTDGKIDESSHAYLDATNGRTGQEIGINGHPDGEWSADRYAGDYAGVWTNGEVAGAYPDASYRLSGRVGGGGDAGTNFDPAAADRATIAPVP